MKKNIFFLFLVITYSSFGQNSTDSQYKKQSSVRIDSRIDSLNDKITQLTDFKKQQEELVRQTTQTIANQNSVISSFGIIYTILTILITLVSIGLPILMYQFGIKPSRNALKNLEINLDKRVEDYLKETRNEQIKNSLEHLKGTNIELKNQAISFLSLTAHEGFSDQQLFEFYRLIKSNQLNDIHKSTISYLLASKMNNYADEVFSDEKLLNNLYIKNNAIQYIIVRGFEKFIEPLKYLLDQSDNKSSEFFTFLSSVNMYNSQLTFDFFNCQSLVNHLEKDTLCKIKNDIPFYLTHFKINEEQYKKTYLYQKTENACT